MTVEVQQQQQQQEAAQMKLLDHHRQNVEDAELDSSGMMMTADTSVSSSSASADADGDGCGGGIGEVVETPAADNTRTSRPRGSSVNFSTIEIREYPRCMGDNPAVTGGGPPISIGWTPISTTTLALEDYEAAILPAMDENENDPSRLSLEGDNADKRVRRTPTEFQLPAKLRYEIIYKESSERYTKEQIQDCLNDVQRHKWNRQSSFAMAEFEHIQVILESCARKLKRFKSKLTSGGKKKKQKKTKGQEKKV